MKRQRPTHSRASASYSSIFTAARPDHASEQAPLFPHALTRPASHIAPGDATPSSAGRVGSAGPSRQPSAPATSGSKDHVATRDVGGVKRPPGLRARSTASYARSDSRAQPMFMAQRGTGPSPSSGQRAQAVSSTDPARDDPSVPGAFNPVPPARTTPLADSGTDGAYQSRQGVTSGTRSGNANGIRRARTNSDGHITASTPTTRLIPPGSGSTQSRIRTRTPRMASREKSVAQVPLYRRLLFPALPMDKAVPPIILSSEPSAGLDALNERLYTLIALLLRAYILSWYPSITPRHDRTLLPHLVESIIVPVLSPILTGVYVRPERMVELVLCDVPNVLEMHWRVYWEARAGVGRGVGRQDGDGKEKGRWRMEGGTGGGGGGSGSGHGLETDGEEVDERHESLRGDVRECAVGGKSRKEYEKEVALGLAYHARLPLPYIVPHPPSPPAPPLAPFIVAPTSPSTPTPDPKITNSTSLPPHTHSHTPTQPPSSLPAQQTISPLYLTSLANTILHLHLPPKEYASDVQRIMGREVLGRVVLGSVVRRLGEGWFWVGVVLRLVGEPGAFGGANRAGGRGEGERGEKQAGEGEGGGGGGAGGVEEMKGSGTEAEVVGGRNGRSRRASPSVSAFATSAGHLQKDTTPGKRSFTARKSTWSSTLAQTFLRAYSLTCTLITIAYSVMSLLCHACASGPYPPQSTLVAASDTPTDAGPITGTTMAPQTGLEAPWLALFRLILGVDGHNGLYHVPWGLRLAWGAVEVVITLLSPLIDRILPRLIHAHLTPRLCISLIDELETILLPLDGYPGPAVPDPLPAEVRDMKDRLERRLCELLPGWTVAVPLSPSSGLAHDESVPPARPSKKRSYRPVPAAPQVQSRPIPSTSPLHITEPLMSPSCNAHLVGMMLEAIVGALIPELVQRDDTGSVQGGSQADRDGAERGHGDSGRRGNDGDDGDADDGDVLGLRWRTTRRAGALADAMGYDSIQ